MIRPGLFRLCLAVLLLVAAAATVTLDAWGQQGHRLVGLVAASRLTPVARQNVEWLLDGQSLADVSSWADRARDDNYQTSWWHFLNIPPEATRYDRDRDCPRQPGVAEGSRADKWRDCIVDRILYHHQRLSDLALDRADRAIALKWLVHFVGDLHQPFHALGVARGGNDIPVTVFGSATCGRTPQESYPCNLHGLWDSSLIAHRELDDQRYLAELEKTIATRGWQGQPRGEPPDWALQSRDFGRTALLPPHGQADEAYYLANIGKVDERLALAGLRLAAMLNEALTNPAPVPAIDCRREAAPVKQIVAVADAIIAADNAREIDRVLSLYADDAVLSPPNEEPVQGRAAIRPRYEALFERFDPAIEGHVVEACVTGPSAFVRGRNGGRLVGRAGRSSRSLDDVYLMLLRPGADGSWRISHLMWHQASPPPSRPAARD